MVVIGTSAGGIDALMKILPAFKAPSSLSVALVIHLHPQGENLIPSLMSPDCEFKIKEAESGEPIIGKTIYVAPVNYHLCLEPNHTLSLSSEPLLNFSRPSIDMLFESAAYAYHKHVLGILLTGANDDGARGLKCIQDTGGLTLIQNPESSEFPMMPKSALAMFKPNLILNLDQIAKFITELSLKDQNEN
jgi:two-component system chemotaxis response regulator CheB